MKFLLKKRRGWLLPAMVAAGLVLLVGLGITGVGALRAEAASAMLTVPPGLTATWWQWAMSIPSDHNPLLDETGALCAEGQSGEYWFLAGVWNESGEATRECAIPAGKRILFPLVNMEVDTYDKNGFVYYCGQPPITVKKMEDCARHVADSATAVQGIVDGEDVVGPDMAGFRVASPFFQVDLPKNNLLGPAPAEDVTVVSDGYWILLPPLSPGQHQIVLGGTINMADNAEGTPLESPMQFTTVVTYNLTVVGDED